MKYNLTHRILHYLIAIGVLFQFTKVLGRADDGSIFYTIYEMIPSWHSSIGGIVMLLLIAKLIVIGIAKVSKSNPAYSVKRTMPVKIGHIALNVVLFAVPLTAMAFMVSKGYPLQIFGFELLGYVDLSPSTASFLRTVGSAHSPLSLALIVLVFGHIGFALNHKIKGDPTSISM